MANSNDNRTRALVEFVKAVLDDDHGISTEAYEKLLVLIGDDPDCHFESLLMTVKCTEGRHYLPEGDPEREQRLAKLKARLDEVREQHLKKLCPPLPHSMPKFEIVE